jgi:hypothetical protein
MIEVFKTDVTGKDRACMLINEIHGAFGHCRANFDLDDCDHILRVTGITGEAEAYRIISLVKSFGNKAEILPDDDPLIGEKESIRQGEVVLSSLSL